MLWASINSAMPNTAVLRLGYPGKVKALICLPLVACVVVAIRTLVLTSAPLQWWDLSIVIGLVVCALPVGYVWRSSCVIDSDGATRTSLWGTTRFRRQDFLAHELIAQEPGETPDLLLRFKSGVLFLSAGHMDRSSHDVVEFVRSNWNTGSSAYQAPALGKVDPIQVFEYESLHVGALIGVGVLALLAAIRFPIFGMVAVIGAFCFRAVWRALGRIETNEEGITFIHRFAKPVQLKWSEIESAAYWSSFAQGGLRLHGAGKTIRAYRWIGRYPMLDRLLHDNLSEAAFAPVLQLPIRVDLNRRRRLGVLLPYFLLISNAALMLWEGNMVVFGAVTVLPTLVAAAMIWGSSRELEIDKDGVRDVWRYLSFRKVNQFRREQLIEARLGRQLTVGGLWMKFGDTRLEIANSDTGLAPEQILSCLRREWAWDQEQPGENDRRLRGAA